MITDLLNRLRTRRRQHTESNESRYRGLVLQLADDDGSATSLNPDEVAGVLEDANKSEADLKADVRRASDLTRYRQVAGESEAKAQALAKARARVDELVHKREETIAEIDRQLQAAREQRTLAEADHGKCVEAQASVKRLERDLLPPEIREDLQDLDVQVKDGRGRVNGLALDLQRALRVLQGAHVDLKRKGPFEKKPVEEQGRFKNPPPSLADRVEMAENCVAVLTERETQAQRELEEAVARRNEILQEVR